MVAGAGMLGAALGFGASRANQYYRAYDEDRGQLFNRYSSRRRFAKRKPPVRRLRVVNRLPARGGRRRKSTIYKKTRSQNGVSKRLKIKRKMPMARAPPRMQKNILYPASFATTLFVGEPRHTVGTGHDLQIGNMVYRLGPRSSSDAYSSFEVWRMTSLAATADGTGTVTGDVGIGTNHFDGSTTQADILSGADQSKLLRIQDGSHSLCETKPHYMKATGAIHRDINPTAYVAGFSINLQFLSYRQVKQQLCVRLVRIKQQALEDQWGQSSPGSATKTLDVICSMVNSQKTIDPQEFEILYETKTILPGYAPGAAHPKETRVKRYLPTSYLMSNARKVYSHSTSEWGAELTPTSKRDNGCFNHCFLVYSVRPIQQDITAPRLSQTAPQGGSATLSLTDTFEGGTDSNVQGANTSALFRVNGTLKTFWRAAAVRRVNPAS